MQNRGLNGQLVNVPDDRPLTIPRAIQKRHTLTMIKRRYILPLIGVLLLLTSSCTVKYSFSGASVNYALSKTVSVSYFNNMAAMVAPLLSPTLTDELTSKLASQTRLQVVPEDGDLSFSGEITGYSSDPVAISGDEYAIQNRLTITVKVKFVNKNEPQYSFEKTFSNYGDYNTDILLSQAENTMIPEIVEKLVDDIFNEALSNW